MSIAKELVKILPKEWGLWVGRDEISVSQFITSLRQDIHLDGEQESPAFINWALDELAKRNVCPSLDFDDKNGQWLVFCSRQGCECPTSTGHHPTKTLALAHALIALGENDG